METLTQEEEQLLDFAALRWRSAGLRDQALRARFGLSATGYFQRLHNLLDRPEALAYAPLTVRRLQRLRDARALRRSHQRN